MNKCIASQDGICRNAYAFGLRCDGYNTQCKLKPHYDNIENMFKGLADSFRRAFGITGDKAGEQE